MGQYQVTGPDGGEYQFEAGSDEEAAAAVDELFSTTGGQAPQGPGPAPQGAMPPGPAAEEISRPQQFDQAFAEGRPENRAAARPDLEAAMNAPADFRGRVATAGNALSWGGFDEIMGIVEGGIEFAKGGNFNDGYSRMRDQVRDDIAGYAKRRPDEHMALDMVASIPGGAGLFRAAVKKAGPVVGSGIAGGTYGAVRGGLEGEGGLEERGMSAAIGGGIGTVIGLGAGKLGQAIGNRAGRNAGAAALPSNAAIKAKSSALFQQAENSGVGFGPQAIQGLGNIRPAMMGPNIAVPKMLPGSHDNAIRALQSVDNLASQPRANFSDIMTVRGNIQDFADAAQKGSKDQAAALRILDAYDNWMERLDQTHLTNGNVTPAEAFKMWDQAKALWAQQAKTAIVERIVDQAKKKSADSFGNANLAGKLRKGFIDLTADERRFKWFSPAEKKAIEWASKGGNMGKTLAAVDALTPGASSVARAGKSAGAIALGVAVPGLAPVLGTAAAVGTGARMARNIRSKSAAETVQNIVKSGTGKVPFDAKAAEVSADNYAARLSQAAVPGVQHFRPVFTVGDRRGSGGGGGGGG